MSDFETNRQHNYYLFSLSKTFSLRKKNKKIPVGLLPPPSPHDCSASYESKQIVFVWFYKNEIDDSLYEGVDKTSSISFHFIQPLIF